MKRFMLYLLVTAECVSTSAFAKPFVFDQPALTSIAASFTSPRVLHRAPPANEFNLAIWELNPQQPDGNLVSVTNWDGGQKTGLYVHGKPDTQAGFVDKPGTTLGQVDGHEVGAYINSRDLGPRTDKLNTFNLIITPGFRLSPQDRPAVFEQPGGKLDIAFDLQVPTAVDGGNEGSRSYVTMDAEFHDTQSDHSVSANVNVFYNEADGGKSSDEIIFFDPPTKGYDVYAPMTAANKWIQPLAGNQQLRPWRGYRHFQYAISRENFATLLALLKARFPKENFSPDPQTYKLSSFHLNAETISKTSPTELGWSMRGLHVGIDDQ